MAPEKTVGCNKNETMTWQGKPQVWRQKKLVFVVTAVAVAVPMDGHGAIPRAALIFGWQRALFQI